VRRETDGETADGKGRGKEGVRQRGKDEGMEGYAYDNTYYDSNTYDDSNTYYDSNTSDGSTHATTRLNYGTWDLKRINRSRKFREGETRAAKNPKHVNSNSRPDLKEATS
jgi:hypothetical protein